MRYSLLAGLLLAASAASAQSSSYSYPLQVWPEVQGELALRNGDYLLVSVHGERTLQSSRSADQPLGFDLRRALVGYEHFASANWSYGGTFRLDGYGGGFGQFVPEALLRHRSPVFGSVTFGQRLSLEYRKPYYPGSYPFPAPDGEAWVRLRLDLEKVFPVGSATANVTLRPRLSAEASTHVRLQKADGDPDERTIQYTSLRGEVGVRVSSLFDFTPWFAYQTSYNNGGGFTSTGNYNVTIPAVGLDLRFTILPAGASADRQVLPTQH